MKAMLTGFSAIILIAICAFIILNTLGFEASAVHSGNAVRLD